ncbi:MAG TPA: FAD-dependent oxidoreductase, partial [Solirubrobacterales bacterium]|nr:FAD-dependent oxidoreductase [Solirubrobacterales bacterium]
VWSADPAQMWTFPAGFLAEFFENHRVLQLRDRPSWRSITGGSRGYVEALIAPFRDRVHLRARVRRIERCAAEVVVSLEDSCELFDEVVVAVHSDVALRILADPSPLESEVLGAIPYQRNEAVLHRDPRLMPRRRAAWASWNFHLTERPTGRTTVTYHMNRLQSLHADRDFFVTLNMTEAIDPAAVIRTIDYAHPVFTPEGIAAQRRWSDISGKRQTHYCGAYWRWGFHEDGVWSALRVSERLGGRGPLPQPGERAAVAELAEPVDEELAEAA